MDRQPARSFEDLIVFKRKGRADKARLMNVAQGSLEEARYYLRLAHDLGYGSNPVLTEDGANPPFSFLLTSSS
jgi:hypothetical protein